MKRCSTWLSCALALLCVSLYGCGGGDAPSGGGGGGSRSGDESARSDSGGASDGAASNSDDGSSDGSSDGTATVSTEGWGHLKGKFIVTGAPAPAKTSVAGSDAAYCGKFTLVDETVVAGPDGELANVILTLYSKRGDDAPKTHESYAASASDSVIMNNEHCRFAPHVTLLRTTQKLVIKNSDTVGHNTKIDSRLHPINPIIPPGQSLEETGFDEAERLPVGASCSIHTWMKGYLVVSDSPYMAKSDESGEFLIENLPAGKHTFTVWQEKSGYLSDVEVNGKAESWRLGRVEVTITEGKTTDLGEVKVAYDKLAG